MSKARRDRDGITGARKGKKPDDAVSAKRAGPPPSPGQEPMNASQMECDDRIARARQKISDGFYDRDEVRRAIAEALAFVLSARRN